MWVLAFLLVLPLVEADCPNGAIYDQNFDKCYLYVADQLPFLLADQNCSSRSSGGHLVWISNGFENSMVWTTAAQQLGSGNFWIGANLLNSASWTWIDGSQLSYSNFMSGSPGAAQLCGYSTTSNGQWGASLCNATLSYVCAFPNIELTTPAVHTCPTPRPIPGHCPSGWTYYQVTDACYYVGFQKNFNDAESDCVRMQSHLTSIHSKEESEFIQDLAWSSDIQKKTSGMTWIGLHKVQNLFVWTDGTSVDFINWQPKKPAGDICVETFSDYEKELRESSDFHKWRDIGCDEVVRTYVCKQAAQH